MKLEKSLAYVRAGSDEALAEAARDLGHELPRNRFELLAQYMAGLAEIARSDLSPYQRGFIEALGSVAGAYCAEVVPEKQLNAAVQTVRSRSGWDQILLAIAEGNYRPSAIAAKAALPVPQVSRSLGDLEEAGLVDRSDPAPGEDGRSRPAQLSLLGRQIVERVRPSKWQSHVDPSLLLEAAVRALAHVASEGTVSLVDFPSQLAKLGSAASPVSSELLRHASECNLIRVVDDVAVSEFHVKERMLVGLLLGQELSGRRASTIDAILHEADDDGVLLIRSEDLRCQWDLALTDRQVSFRTRNSPELEYLPPLTQPYDLVYESNSLIGEDLRNRPEIAKELIEKARNRICLVAENPSDSAHPSGYEFKQIQIRVDHHA